MKAETTPADDGTAREASSAVPRGWMLKGSRPEDYAVGAESKPGAGTKRAFIRSRPEPGGFGTLMQMFRAERYRGKRCVVAASISTDGVDDWCGLWMRVDGRDGTPLAFDNMDDRRISGHTPSQRYRVVLDVADDAEYVAFGVLLSGNGAVGIEDVTFEETSKDTQVTDTERRRSYPDAPTNLGFD